jgi:hypothetical protein
MGFPKPLGSIRLSSETQGLLRAALLCRQNSHPGQSETKENESGRWD